MRPERRRAVRPLALLAIALAALAALALPARAESPQFTLSLTPASPTVVRGQSAPLAVTATATGSFSGSVALTVTGLPAGVTATLTPATVVLPKNATGTSALTLVVGATTVPGSYAFTVTGRSGTLVRTVVGTLTVPQPDFTITGTPAAQVVGQGGTVAYQLTLTPLRGFNAAVSLAATVSGTGVTATITPASVSLAGSTPLTATLLVSATTSAAQTLRAVLVTAQGGGLTRTLPLVAQVGPSADFTVASSPTSLTVTAGSAVTSSVSVTALRGFAGPVALSVTGLPAGATAIFAPGGGTLSPATTSLSATLTLSTTSATPAGAFPVTVVATSGTLARSTPLTLTVTAANRLTLTAAPVRLVVAPGRSGTSTLTVVRSSGNAPVTFSATGLPAGVTAAFAPTITSTNTSLITLTAAAGAPTGSYPITIVATAGSASAQTTVTFVVEVPGQPFTLSGNVSGLAPGVRRPIDLTITNNGSASLPVTSLTVALTASSAPGCSATANYAVSQFSGTYPLTVPGGSTRALSQLGVPQAQWPAITMLNLPTNQDACKGAVLTVTYSGAAAGGVTP